MFSEFIIKSASTLLTCQPCLYCGKLTGEQTAKDMADVKAKVQGVGILFIFCGGSQLAVMFSSRVLRQVEQ